MIRLNMTNSFIKNVFLFLLGGFSYVSIELLTRGRSHISMLIAGGICFLGMGNLDKLFPNGISLISQMLLSAILITIVEFITGMIVNIWLKEKVWDYSNLPYNLYGQICLLFSNLWFLLSFVGIKFYHWLQYTLFGERKTRYKLL